MANPPARILAVGELAVVHLRSGPPNPDALIQHFVDRVLDEIEKPLRIGERDPGGRTA